MEAMCTCTDFIRTGSPCKHGVAVLLALKQGPLKIEPTARLPEFRSQDASSAAVAALEPKNARTTLLRALRSAEREVRDTKAAAATEGQQLRAAMNELQR